MQKEDENKPRMLYMHSGVNQSGLRRKYRTYTFKYGEYEGWTANGPYLHPNWGNKYYILHKDGEKKSVNAEIIDKLYPSTDEKKFLDWIK